jgi:hypothetical protein
VRMKLIAVVNPPEVIDSVRMLAAIEHVEIDDVPDAQLETVMTNPAKLGKVMVIRYPVWIVMSLGFVMVNAYKAFSPFCVAELALMELRVIVIAEERMSKDDTK